jgi:cytochrome c oxidase assembly protein subunit 15
LPAALVGGFGTAIALWIAWFITHLPWIGMAEQVALPTVIGVWSMGLLWAGWMVGRPKGLAVGTLAGIISAALGLLILGSKIVIPTKDRPAFVPNAALVSLGFILTGVALGAICGTVGGTLRRRPPTQPLWFMRFVLVTAGAIAPLIFIGGLVTSTDSGMAVPDWPNTFGSNMFLYPLGPRARPDVYLEHAHRLFGTLAGVAIVTLVVWSLVAPVPKAAKYGSIAALLAVIGQGVLGGTRVIEDSRWLAAIHGVVAQGIVALIVWVAVKSWLHARPVFRFHDQPAQAGKLRLLSTAAFHTTMLQLVLGAIYRQMRSPHVLYTHIVLSLIVVLTASMAGGLAAKQEPPVSKLGKMLCGVVGLQFLLGWAAWLAGTTTSQKAENALQAIVRTVHQANGALLVAVLAAVWAFARNAPRERAEALRA